MCDELILYEVDARLAELTIISTSHMGLQDVMTAIKGGMGVTDKKRA